jgi:hypothetical protein
VFQRQCRKRSFGLNRRRICGEFCDQGVTQQSIAGNAFSDQASSYQRDQVWRLAHGTDQPILTGLRHILAQSDTLA